MKTSEQPSLHLHLHVEVESSFQTLLSSTAKSWKSLKHASQGFLFFVKVLDAHDPSFVSSKCMSETTCSFLEIMPSARSDIDLWLGPVTSVPVMQKAGPFRPLRGRWPPPGRRHPAIQRSPGECVHVLAGSPRHFISSVVYVLQANKFSKSSKRTVPTF